MIYKLSVNIWLICVFFSNFKFLLFWDNFDKLYLPKCVIFTNSLLKVKAIQLQVSIYLNLVMHIGLETSLSEFLGNRTKTFVDILYDGWCRFFPSKKYLKSFTHTAILSFVKFISNAKTRQFANCKLVSRAQVQVRCPPGRK